MRKGKILTAFILITAVFLLNMSVSAEEQTQIYIEAGYGGENAIAEIDLKLSGNNGLSAYSIEINYDPSKLRFVDALQGDAIDGGIFYCNGDYDEDALRIVWSNNRNKLGDGTIARLRFKTLNGTAETSTPISIGHSVLGNDDFEEIIFETDNDELKIGKELKKGDVNKDGKVDVADVVWLNQYLLNPLYEPDFTTLGNAEVSGNKKIDTMDSMTLINYVTMFSGVI
jgi:hypothetical protein